LEAHVRNGEPKAARANSEVCACALSLHATYRLPPTALWREVHAAQEVLKARVGAQTINSRIHFEINELAFATLVGLFQPRECLVGIA
jgi:hypothetical protein